MHNDFFGGKNNVSGKGQQRSMGWWSQAKGREEMNWSIAMHGVTVTGECMDLEKEPDRTRRSRSGVATLRNGDCLVTTFSQSNLMFSQSSLLSVALTEANINQCTNLYCVICDLYCCLFYFLFLLVFALVCPPLPALRIASRLRLEEKKNDIYCF